MNTSTQPSRETLEQFGVLVGLFFAYVIGARIGLNLHAVNDFATLIWPPSGIALAGFLLYGFRVWPAILLAAFLVNFSNGAPLLLATIIGIGNTLGTAAGAFFIKEYSNYKPNALRVRDSIAIVAGALIAPLIAAAIGVTALWLGGQVSVGQYGLTWQTWLIGDMVGILVYTPLILKWWNRGIYERTRAQQIELLLAVLASALTAYYVFWVPNGSIVYYLFIPLTWAALRTGPRGTTLSIFAIAVIGIWGTLSGHGPFVIEGLLQMRLFIGITSGVLLIIAALVEERRNALNELESHVKELEIALEKIHSEDEAKKKFLTVLAHELRNPLATILSSIELIYMEHRSVPAAMKSSLETISERSRAMVHLLDDLLDISRVSHKKLRLHKELVLIDHFIDRLVLSVQPIMRRYSHTFSVTKPDQELFVEADPTRLEQIFVNLLSNAAKYTSPRGLIELSAKYEQDLIAIRVCDSGVGIPKNMLTRIFEPFFQVNHGVLTNQGLGVGLALTRELVEMHGGTIEASSAGVDHGSQFTVRLPLAHPPSEHAPPSAASASPRKHRPTPPRPGKAGLRILVVDDNESATRALVRLLELRGHVVAAAYDGTGAITLAPEFKPQVVLLDIGLPDMDGYEVAKILRAQDEPYHLIALTGYGQADDKERAVEAGFEAHLTKPAGLKEIEAALRKVTDASKKATKAER